MVYTKTGIRENYKKKQGEYVCSNQCLMQFNPLITSRSRFPSSLYYFETKLCAQVARIKDLIISQKKRADEWLKSLEYHRKWAETVTRNSTFILRVDRITCQNISNPILYIRMNDEVHSMGKPFLVIFTSSQHENPTSRQIEVLNRT